MITRDLFQILWTLYSLFVSFFRSGENSFLDLFMNSKTNDNDYVSTNPSITFRSISHS